MAKRKSGKGRRASRRQQRQRRQRRNLIIVGAVIAVGVAGFVLLGAGGPGRATADDTRITLDPTIGPDDAPITITEFGDFGCPSCRAWHNAGIREQLIANYGDRLRFIFKDFPVITAQSPRAAEAAQCALDQGRFWEYHDLVYENFQGLNDDNLQFYALQTGLDVDAFDDCLNSGLHRETVRADWQEAQQLGLRGTPSFLVNGQFIAGVPYYETFAAQIEAFLSAS